MEAAGAWLQAQGTLLSINWHASEINTSVYRNIMWRSDFCRDYNIGYAGFMCDQFRNKFMKVSHCYGSQLNM